MDRKRRCVVLGKGFLGKAFERNGYDVKDFKITNSFTTHCAGLLMLKNYDVIINCIGKSNTQWCEDSDNFEEAMWSNAGVPKLLSEYCKENNKKLVHISTGCLYSGEEIAQFRGFNENDFITSHCNYVTTKWAGEMFCDRSKDLILRPRLLYGDFYDKNNQIIKLSKHSAYTLEANSWCNVQTIVEATERLLEEDQSGVFNVCNKGSISPFRLAFVLDYPNRMNVLKTEEHRDNTKIYLVHNIMDTNKLNKFYEPTDVVQDAIQCANKLKKEGYL